MLIAELDISVGPPPRAEALQPVLHVRHRGLGRDRSGLAALALRLNGPAIRIECSPGAVHREVAAAGVAQPHAPVEQEPLGILEQSVERIGVLAPVFPDINATHRHGTVGIGRAGEHVDGIGEVCHPEPWQAVAGFAVELPATQQLGVERTIRKMKQIGRPIHIGLDDIGDRPLPPRFVEAHGCGDAADLTELSCGDVPGRRPEMAIAAPLSSSLHDPTLARARSSASRAEARSIVIGFST